MKVKLLHQDQEARVLAVIFEKEEDCLAGLQSVARDYQVSSGELTAVGAFRRVTLAYFDRETMTYQDIPVEEQVEVLALTGNVARNAPHTQAALEPKIHAHAVVGRRDGSTLGGHVRAATVWPTLEVILTESPAHLRRTIDAETGLALIDVSEAEEAPLPRSIVRPAERGGRY